MSSQMLMPAVIGSEDTDWHRGTVLGFSCTHQNSNIFFDELSAIFYLIIYSVMECFIRRYNLLNLKFSIRWVLKIISFL